MPGYIVVEPSLRIERVPEHLLGAEELLWPPERNSLADVTDEKATPFITPADLYHRARLRDSIPAIFVWSQRDHNALPDQVSQEIREMSRRDLDGTPVY